MKKTLQLSALALAFLAITMFQAGCSSVEADPSDSGSQNEEAEVQLISASSLLNGLSAGAAFPFIDTTPNHIIQAHIAVTDATTNCAAGAAAPSNVQVLVGQAGVSLISVMGAATNTGISTTTGQCVFHVTVNAGQGGLPSTVTDIVVVNGGSAALTGKNTVTATAKVGVREQKDP